MQDSIKRRNVKVYLDRLAKPLQPIHQRPNVGLLLLGGEGGGSPNPAPQTSLSARSNTHLWPFLRACVRRVADVWLLCCWMNVKLLSTEEFPKRRQEAAEGSQGDEYLDCVEGFESCEPLL